MSTGTPNPEIERLAAEIDRFRASNGDMSATAFGMWAVGDPNLIRDMNNGREPRWKTVQAIRAKMAEGVAA